MESNFCSMTEEELQKCEGGIGLFAALGIGALCLTGGTALGLGTAKIISML